MSSVLIGYISVSVSNGKFCIVILKMFHLQNQRHRINTYWTIIVFN